MRALLISNSGRPLLDHCSEVMVDFLKPRRRLGFGYDPDGAATSTRINLALYERDSGSAAKILAASNLEELVDSTG